MRRLLAAAALACALCLPAAAQASFIVDRNASGATLRVTGSTAIVNWTSRGTRRSVVLAGAVNARQPSQSVPQVAFRAAYRYGAQAGGSCKPYTGPAARWGA